MKIQSISYHPHADLKLGVVIVYKTFLELHIKTVWQQSAEADGDLCDSRKKKQKT